MSDDRGPSKTPIHAFMANCSLREIEAPEHVPTRREQMRKELRNLLPNLYTDLAKDKEGVIFSDNHSHSGYSFFDYDYVDPDPDYTNPGEGSSKDGTNSTDGSGNDNVSGSKDGKGNGCKSKAVDTKLDRSAASRDNSPSHKYKVDDGVIHRSQPIHIPGAEGASWKEQCDMVIGRYTPPRKVWDLRKPSPEGKRLRLSTCGCCLASSDLALRFQA